MKGYFAYIRVSTAKQGELGSSLSEQRSSIETYAARNGLVIAEWFEERETAAKQGRTQFTRMMKRLARREAPGVIIHKIDRSARNLRDWSFLADLMDQGVDVRFAHESLDLGSRGGRLAADIQAVIASDFIRNLRQEIRKGIDGALKRGLYPLPAPIGYRDCGKGKLKEIDPVMGPLVRKAFELYATGRFTVRDLCDEMARRGLRNRQGGPVSPNGMWEMLRRPFYIGLIHIKRTGQTFAGAHSPLITKAVFDRCQAILSGRAYALTTRHAFLYSRLIKCGRCDRALIGEQQKGHVYYRCHSDSCRGTSLREADISEELHQLLQHLQLDPTELRDLRDLTENALARVKEEKRAAQQAAKLGLARCDELLSRLTDAFLDGAIERELFDAKKAKLLSDRRGHLDAIETPPEESPEITKLKKLELGKVALQKLQSPNHAEIRNGVVLIMSNLVADGKNLAFALHYPFGELILKRAVTNGTPYSGHPRNGGTLFTRRASHSQTPTPGASCNIRAQRL
jgi:site-specific DNA recombinase